MMTEIDRLCRLALGRRDAALAALVIALDDKLTAIDRLCWLRAEVVRAEGELAALCHRAAAVKPALQSEAEP
jgi:hypothetical protein